MNVKRIIIPTLTMVIIASQLLGCASVSKSELLTMLEQGDQIEIEIASPRAEAEQGEATSILWEQLALLDTNTELRKAWDDLLGITMTDTGKNGMLYVNESGENVNNNTLRVALHNREFQKVISDDVQSLELANGALSQYADIEVDETAKAIYAGINGYFNLLPDNIENYANPDSTLDRAEFMAMVMRAETPVTDDLEADEAFATAVGQNDLNIYAQALAEDSYLNLSDKSLNNMTYNGTISRAEAVYLLMNHYYADELATVNTKDAALNDATDGGDIASKQDFAGKDYATSYELAYAIQNADKGTPSDLYNALVLAESKGIISSDTRWDEALTRTEAVELLVSVYMDEDGIPEFNFKQGTYDVQESNPLDFYYKESENGPDSEAAQQETNQQVETTQTADMKKSNIDTVKKNLDRLLSKGIINQAEYDEMLKEQQELNELADENGVISGSDFDNYYSEKYNTDDNSSSGGTQYQEKLPDYAVTKPSGEGDGSAAKNIDDYRDPRLAGIRSN